MKKLPYLILPAIICFCVLFFIKIPFDFYPLSFGLIIGIFNFKTIKRRNPLITISLSLLASYVVFYISYFTMIPIGFLLEAIFGNVLNDETIGYLVFFISPYVLAPLITFYLYKLVFKITITKRAKVIVIISVLLIIIQSYIFSYLNINKNSINSFTGWQVIMALGLQLIIHKNKVPSN